MTRLITDEQILSIYQTLQDLTGLLDCNCGYIVSPGVPLPEDHCDGTCTYACAVAGIAILDALPVASQEAATGPQEPQEAAAAPVPRYTVNLHVISLHGGERVREVYQGGDEAVMYSHVSAIEWTLAMTGGTAEIEIVEDGRERWIDYQDGKRDGLPQEAE